MKSTKILLIDDSDDFRVAVKDYLKMHDKAFQVFEASNGEMGVIKASCIHPDIVVMDLNLPHANGFETTKLIKNDHPDCSVIVLTMFEVPVFRETAQKMGAAEFIGKNEVYEKLIPTIKKCLEKK